MLYICCDKRLIHTYATTKETMENSIKVGRQFYNINIEHFSLEYGDSVKNVKTLENLIYFSNLKSASFNSSDLNNEGLAFLSNLSQLENLNLQETNISDEGIKNLIKLKNLKYLRLKENAQLTDDCVQYLIGIEALEDLQIQETSITQKGLDQLTALKNLKNILFAVLEIKLPTFLSKPCSLVGLLVGKSVLCSI